MFCKSAETYNATCLLWTNVSLGLLNMQKQSCIFFNFGVQQMLKLLIAQ